MQPFHRDTPLHKDKNLASAVESRVLQPQEKLVGTPKRSWKLWDQEDQAIFPSHAGYVQGAQPDIPPSNLSNRSGSREY